MATRRETKNQECEQMPTRLPFGKRISNRRPTRIPFHAGSHDANFTSSGFRSSRVSLDRRRQNTDRQTDFIGASRRCHMLFDSEISVSLCHHRPNFFTSNLAGRGGAYTFIASSSSSILSRSADDHT